MGVKLRIALEAKFQKEVNRTSGEREAEKPKVSEQQWRNLRIAIEAKVPGRSCQNPGNEGVAQSLRGEQTARSTVSSLGKSIIF
jgi:hypothetical protein